MHQAVKECTNSGGKSEFIQADNSSWAEIIAKLTEPEKIYNTLLKTRFALENNLITQCKY
jgi:hypothetical protein